MAVKIDPRTLGPQRASVSLYDPKGTPLGRAEVRWVAGALVNLSDDRLDFQKLQAGIPAVKTLTIAPNLEILREPWSPTMLHSIKADPDDELSVVRMNKEDKSISVDVQVIPQGNDGRGNGLVTLEFGDPIGPIIVPVTWMYTQSIYAEPDSIFLGTVALSAEWTRKILIRSMDGPLSHVEMQNPSFNLSTSIIRENSWECSISGISPREMGPFAELLELLVTCDGEQVALRIRVTGLVNKDNVRESNE